MKLHRVMRWLPLTATCALPGAALAQGFGLNEIGSCAVGRGFAVTSSPCHDASVIYWNPGAATMLNGLSVYVGGAQIALNGRFTQDTTGLGYDAAVPDAYPPHAFLTWTGRAMGGRKLSLGAGFYVPYGLTSQWDSTFPGRFQALKASLKTFYVQPNIAFELAPGWSIGGGPVYGHSSVELIQAIDLADLAAKPSGGPGGGPVTFAMLGIGRGTEFARVNLKGKASGWGFNVGLHGRIGNSWSVGARYLSKVSFDYNDADATFEQRSTGLVLAANNPLSVPANTPVDAVVGSQFQSGGALVAQKGATSITHPWQVQFGLGFTGLPGTTISFDAARIGWSGFDTLRIQFLGPASASSRTLFEKYQDVWAYRAGIEYQVTNAGSLSGLALRGGFSAVPTAPAPDETVTALLPDQERRTYSLGLGIPLGGGFVLDGGYLRLETPGRRGRITERTSLSQTAAQLNTGWYSLDANIVSISLRASF